MAVVLNVGVQGNPGKSQQPTIIKMIIFIIEILYLACLIGHFGCNSNVNNAKKNM